MGRPDLRSGEYRGEKTSRLPLGGCLNVEWGRPRRWGGIGSATVSGARRCREARQSLQLHSVPVGVVDL
ncbi:hypothetical protein FF36_05633 [Frankia torreyi]|uniref:Uncharacterized protein n=1 Tax=Frankia torreyi TaxID=1856 RepID=A0A0D8B813_9ACTN|nr:hypothetical protein FF36_05633 [Frankia torreyi]KQM04138.1 hypothetical protein FF86_103062 [Frankia sp. CpI1-P]